MIQGNALNSTNGQMSNVVVRLRDARFGRIVDTQLTDKSGLFAFKAIDPGTYVVEIVANDQSILAASQLLNVNPGAAVSAIVKLPFRMPAFGGSDGQRQHSVGGRPRGPRGAEHRRGRRADEPGQPQSSNVDVRAHFFRRAAFVDHDPDAPPRRQRAARRERPAAPAPGARRTPRRTKSIFSIASRSSTGIAGCASPSSFW